MAEQLIISVSGMRGIVGENLTSAVAAEYGSSFGAFLKDTCGKNESLSVCIGTDSRPSGPMLKSAVTQGLCSVGIDVIDLGLVATPSVGVMVRELKCDGGVVITASHNPGQYNGIKLLLDNGGGPPAETAAKIRQRYFDKAFTPVEPSACGHLSCNDSSNAVHLAKVLAIVEKETIAAKKFKVVLDSINGAGCVITKKLLAEFGCQVVAINDEPTGEFAHVPEPLAENLTGLCEVVKAEHAQIGLAQDPDADRLAIVDENGTYIGEEYSLALAAKYIFSKKTGNAATNLSTSRMIDDIAEKAGGRVYRSAVGEVNVVSAMLEHDCIIGGEGGGGVIDLRVGPIRDSLAAIALVLQLMAETGKTVSQLVDEIGGYHVIKTKFTADDTQAQQIFDSMKKHFADARVDNTDGCRLDFEDGWLHLRVSNTEPIMRLVVEAKSLDTAQKYIETIVNIHKEIVG